MVKEVPDLIDRLLKPRSLAYWFMDDGCKSRTGYPLCTHGFSYSNNTKLLKVLKRYDLKGYYSKRWEIL